MSLFPIFSLWAGSLVWISRAKAGEPQPRAGEKNGARKTQMNGHFTRTKKLKLRYELAVRSTVQFTLQEFFFCTCSLQNRSFQSPSLVSKSPSLVSKIFIISLLCVWRVWQGFPIVRNSFKFLKHFESETNQFEIIFKLLERFSTQFRVKESFKLLFAI